MPLRLSHNTAALCLALAPVIALTGCVTSGREPYDPVAAGELPRYIFFNKSPTAGGPRAWRQARPESFTAESCREIIEAVGTPGDARLRIGVHFVFSILEDDPATLAAALRNLLSAAQAADVPVLITLDGQNWWESRADLWNWWDPGRSGYDPRNRENVEWTGWGPEHAVKIGWRNWGRQIRVAPAPNIASPRFLAEHWRRYDVLIPIIVAWYRALPPERKYLFGGLKVGWEASINVNAYYYPDGNRILEQWPDDESRDPQGHDPAKGWTFGVAPLGYAAACTAGLKRGGALTRDDVERLTQQYLLRCSAEAQRRGVPRHLLFTHQGGTYAPWEQHLSFKPAINDYSIPGWSFYSHDPPDCGSLPADLRAAGRRQWAACEWWRGAADEAGWRVSFERTLGFAQCRFVAVYNWESFREIPAALAAVRGLVAPTSQPAPASQPTPAAQPALAAERFRLSPLGEVFVPAEMPADMEHVDLVVHFHGGAATAEREFAAAGMQAVLVTVSIPGLSSAYERPFSDPALFGAILEKTLAELRQRGRVPATAEWGRVCVSSFSAGFGAVRAILKVPAYFARIDALYLADTLYAGYVAADGQRRVDPEDVRDFCRYAQEAAAGCKLLLVTHSYVEPGRYAGTHETADALIACAGAQRRAVDEPGPAGMHVISRVEQGGFQVWGCAGQTGEAHLAHVRNMRYWYERLPVTRRP